MTSPATTPTVGVQDAAKLLKVHPKTVEDLIKAGAIPAGKVGRAWVMLTRDVLAHAERIIMDQTAQRLGARKTRPCRSPKRIGQR